MSVEKQCELLGLARSSYYYQPCGESAENLALMRLLDQLHLDDPTKGARLLQQDLLEKGYVVNLKRVRRLVKLIGIEAIYSKPNLSKMNAEHKKYPYLLRNMTIEAPNQVWAICYLMR